MKMCKVWATNSTSKNENYENSDPSNNIPPFPNPPGSFIHNS